MVMAHEGLPRLFKYSIRGKSSLSKLGMLKVDIIHNIDSNLQ